MNSNVSNKSGAAAAARPIQLVLVRANGPLFYSLAAASLLENGTALAADRLLHFFGADAVFAQWIRTDWLPRKVARAKQMREYVETTWPEYDWSAGHEQYRAMTAAAGATVQRRPSAAHEALARCVAAAQGGVFYRSLARWAEDRRLREMARRMAQEEALSFDHFRRIYDREFGARGFRCKEAWTTALACVRATRDEQVPRAFGAIRAQCAAHVPFPVLDYPEFVFRMGSVIERHGDLGMPERVLLRTWKRSAPAMVQNVRTKVPAWFKPVLPRAV
jgi:hypothetical protein